MRSRGFTLVEIIVVLVILGIFAVMAVPSFHEMVASNHVRSASEQLRTALLLAREEAVKRNGSVTLTCTSSNCLSGWTVTAGTTTLSKQSAFSDSRLSISGPASVVFDRSGRLGGTASFQVQHTDTSRVNCVRVYLSGLADVAAVAC